MVPLETSKLFSCLLPAELDSLKAVTRELTFAPAREIFKEGDAGDGLYIVKSGLVQISAAVSQTERMAVVGRFTSSIVHDLKNPLTSISIASDLACLDTATADSRKIAQTRIRKQVDRISSMVSDILEFTRGPSASIARTKVDCTTFAKSIIEEIEKEIVLRGVTVELKSTPPAVKLSLNPQRLSRVFYNLMLNAVDALPDGGKIKLHFHVTPAEVITEIEDTGCGIAPEILEQLFEAFATFGKPRGTGLGLSISKRIVEEHQGRIYARNDPAGDALFGFALPRPAA